MIITFPPRISPIPFSTDLVTLPRGIPNNKPAITQTTKKARKGLTLQTAINIINDNKARKTMNKAMVDRVFSSGNKIKNNQGLHKKQNLFIPEY
jgi:hypothetical protein